MTRPPTGGASNALRGPSGESRSMVGRAKTMLASPRSSTPARPCAGHPTPAPADPTTHGETARSGRTRSPVPVPTMAAIMSAPPSSTATGPTASGAATPTSPPESWARMPTPGSRTRSRANECHPPTRSLIGPTRRLRSKPRTAASRGNVAATKPVHTANLHGRDRGSRESVRTRGTESGVDESTRAVDGRGSDAVRGRSIAAGSGIVGRSRSKTSSEVPSGANVTATTRAAARRAMSQVSTGTCLCSRLPRCSISSTRSNPSSVRVTAIAARASAAGSTRT